MFESYNEVFEQGETLRKTFDFIYSKKIDIVNFIKKYAFDEVVFIACGSSYWLSLSACMSMQEKLGIRCTAVKSGDVVMNVEYYSKSFKKPLVIVPSRSGSTSETLMAVKLMREIYGSRVLCVVEYPESPILSLSDLCLEIPWANEVSVCQTRSFSNLYLACIMITALTAGDQELLDDLDRYIGEFGRYRVQGEDLIRKVIREFPGWKSLVTLGNGKQYGVTCEGAYICIEMTQFPSNYYGTLEYRHGPIVMADNSCLAVVFCGAGGRELEERMAADIRAKGAKVLAVCAEDDFMNADYSFNLGWKASPEVTALSGIFLMQGFAHLKAVDLGIDPDNPKELVPWIRI